MNNDKLLDFGVTAYRNLNVPVVPGLSEYLDAVSASFCPYIRPSARREQITFTVVESSLTTQAQAEALVFASGLLLTELLRQNRRSVIGSGQRSLFCENIIFSLPNLGNAFGKPMLAWPHWVLKSRYTQVGVLFGKFWKGAIEHGKDGRPLPVPPCHLLSIRESVLKQDPKFFEQASWLRPEFEASEDSGQDVFHLKKMNLQLATQIEAFCRSSDSLSFQQLLRILIMSNIYDQLKANATTELETRKALLRKG